MGQYYTVAFTDTLMAYNNDLGAYLQSGDHHSTFYFLLPDAWSSLGSGDLQQKVYGVAKKMYDDLNAGFRSAEPDDISYMLVKSTDAEKLDVATAQAKPWLTAPNPAVWESTPCVIVDDDGTYRKVPRQEL